MSLTHRMRRPRGAVRLTGLTGERFGTALAALTLTVALMPSVSPAALADDVAQSNAAQSKPDDVPPSIADLEAQISQLNVDLESAQRDAQIATEDYLVAINDLQTATSDAETAQNNADAAAADVDAARLDLGAVVAETYEEGNTGPLDALAPFLTGQSMGDASDMIVTLESVGASADARVQRVEACRAAADTTRALADQRVTDKQTAATQAENAKNDAQTAATNAQTAVTDTETKRSELITQLADQRNTSYEDESKHQEQLEADRQAREEAAARAAVGAPPAASSAPKDPTAPKPTETPSPAPSAEPTPTAPPTPEPTQTAEPTPEPTQAAEEPTPEPTEAAEPTPEAEPTPDPEPTEEPSPEPEPEPEPEHVYGAGADTAIATAETFLGVPYVWAGESYDGVDCSGLTMLSYQAAGISLTHSSRVQYGEGQQVDLADAQPGDLLFWSEDGTQEGIYHVAIYLGDDQMIEAPTFGVPVRTTGVRYSEIMPYVVRP